MSQALRQRPAVNRDNAFFFEALQQGRLVAQQCASCSEFRHPPVPMCPSCHSIEWTASSIEGTGTLVTYSVLHHPVLPPFVAGYLVGLVELDHGVRLVLNLEYAEQDAAIGQSVEVRVVRYDDDLVLPAGFLPGSPTTIVSSTEGGTLHSPEGDRS